MSEPVVLKYNVDGENFTSAGEASVAVKKSLRQMGFPPEAIRRVSIAMYEGEINMVIHADGGEATVNVYPDKIEIILADKGPGIADIPLQCRRAIPQRLTTSAHSASVQVWGFPI